MSCLILRARVTVSVRILTEFDKRFNSEYMTAVKSLPTLIQGGMGVGVSNWTLANAVARLGHLGVVSGTALDAVVARRLQLGDLDGSQRRAISHFPWPEMAQRVMDRFFSPGGKPAEKKHRATTMANLRMKRAAIELLIVSNFVEVFLAKEGHDGWVGINFLEKIQLPNMPSFLGAMLAGVDFVLMGAGIPLQIPGILDGLARWDEVQMRISVKENTEKHSFVQTFDPKDYCPVEQPELKRPKFLAIISSDILAKTFVRRASGYTDGFVVENWTAGGHNAPPRRIDRMAPPPEVYSAKDDADLEKMREIGRPFWLAGGFSTPAKIQEALDAGATGVQLGTIFAYSEESGILPEIKADVVKKYFNGTLKVKTDFRASPTGFPFKVITTETSVTHPDVAKKRVRICDLGYLRDPYVVEGTKIGYRCASEPIDQYVKKGGALEDTTGRHCLCNGLMATIGLAQLRDNGEEPPIITSGDDFTFLDQITDGTTNRYSAETVINYLMSGVKVPSKVANLSNGIAPTGNGGKSNGVDRSVVDAGALRS